MKFTSLILLLVISFGVNAAGKSAFINSKVLLEESPQAIAANNELQEQFGDREKSLRILAGSIKEMEQIYQKDAAIMSSEQKKKAEDNIIQNKRRFQFEQQSLKDDLQARQRELLQKVQVSIKAVIQEYGSKNGYDFIFTDSSIAYANDSVNITKQILDELNK
jgi:outer membrane protein